MENNAARPADAPFSVAIGASAGGLLALALEPAEPRGLRLPADFLVKSPADEPRPHRSGGTRFFQGVAVRALLEKSNPQGAGDGLS